MFNKFKIILFLQLFSSTFFGRVSNTSALTLNIGKAVWMNNNSESLLSALLFNATIFSFDSSNGRFIYANGLNALTGAAGSGTSKIGYFYNNGSRIDTKIPLNTAADLDPNSKKIRTMDCAGSLAFFSAGTFDGTANVLTGNDLYKVDLSSAADLPTPVTMKDWVGTNNAQIDKILYVPGNSNHPECLVVAGFQNAQQTYSGNDNGIVRVLKVSDFTSLGVAKVASGVAAVKFTTTNGSGDLRSLMKGSTGNGPAADFIHSMHYDSKLDRVFIGIYGTNPASSNVYCPYLVCRFDKESPITADGCDLICDSIYNGILPGSTVGADNVITTYNGVGVAVPLIKTMHLGKGSYLISNIQAVNTTAGNNGRANQCIYATPLVNSGSVTNIGNVASKNVAVVGVDFSTEAAAVTDLYRAAPTSATRVDQNDTTCEIPALVGGGPLPTNIATLSFYERADTNVVTRKSANLANITCMEVVYNTVFVGVGEPVVPNAGVPQVGLSTVAGNHRIGVWASTAITNEFGVICGWTPWTRAFGMHLPVYGMHFDLAKLQMWVAHQEPNGTNIAGCSVTSLDSGHSIDSAATANLNAYGATGPTTLVKQLTEDLGKITYLKSFVGHRTANLGNKSVLVACGEKGIAFAKTADTDWSNFGLQSSCPLRESVSTATSNYQFLPFSDDKFSVVKGNVRAVEFSRLNDAGSGRGYFFVGTDKGLYVLRVTGTGAGMSKGNANIPLFSTDYSFVEITLDGKSLKDIKDLAIVGTLSQGRLLVLCAEKLVAVSIATATADYIATFPGGAGISLNITTNADKYGALCIFSDDEVPFSLKLLPSVGSGLFASSLANASSGCGVLLTSKGLYQVRNLYGSAIGALTLEPLFANKLGREAGVNVRSVEVVPLNPWAEHGQVGVVQNTTVANLYIVTGDVNSNKGSSVYVTPLKGSMQPPTTGVDLTTARAAIVADDAYVFGLSDASVQQAAFDLVSANPAFGAYEFGGTVWNKFNISGLSMVSQSWNSDVSGAGVFLAQQPNAPLLGVSGKSTLSVQGLDGMGGEQIFRVGRSLSGINA